MDRNATPAGRLRSGRLALLSLLVVLAVGACGSSSAAGGGGGADVDKIIASTQSIIGTSMVGAKVEGDTIVVTMVNGFGKGGANLFMCSNILIVRQKYDPEGKITMTMVDQSGKELASSADCQ